MKKVKVLHNQNLFDIAIERQGDVRSVFDLALENELSVTDVLLAGMALDVADTPYKNIDIADYYQRRKQQIATADTNSATTVNMYVFPQLLPLIL